MWSCAFKLRMAAGIRANRGYDGTNTMMSEIFLIGGLLAASAAAVKVLNSSVGKPGGAPTRSREMRSRRGPVDCRRVY